MCSHTETTVCSTWLHYKRLVLWMLNEHSCAWADVCDRDMRAILADVYWKTINQPLYKIYSHSWVTCTTCDHASILKLLVPCTSSFRLEVSILMHTIYLNEKMNRSGHWGQHKAAFGSQINFTQQPPAKLKHNRSYLPYNR